MTKVFISYNRKNLDEVRVIAEDLRTGGCDAWMDQELAGGQLWWRKVLAQVREADIIMPSLSQPFVFSEACRREVTYAQALGKAMLPVQVDVVSPQLVGPLLAEMQWVDYRVPSRQTGLLLMRALNALEPSAPLPDPLPPEPEVPGSYLDGLKSRVEDTSDLGRDEQIRLLADLRDRMRGEEAEDAGLLLRRHLQRSDLLLSTANEIDRLLGAGGLGAAVGAAVSPPPVHEREYTLPPTERAGLVESVKASGEAAAGAEFHDFVEAQRNLAESQEMTPAQEAPRTSQVPHPQLHGSPSVVRSGKSPRLAAVLSAVWCGLGQIYNGQIGKGVLFLVLFLISWIAILIGIGYVTTPILWGLGMIDAYKTAERLNLEAGLP
jgi:TM2 domain-containing membrane protein YozV